MIKDKSIINQINKNCNFFADEDKSLKYGECNIKELSSFYSRILEKMEDGKMNLYRKNDYEYNITLRDIHKDIYSYGLDLLIEKNGEIIDSLIIYGFNSNESEITSRYYYIDEKLENLFLLEVVSSENAPLTKKGTYYETNQVDYWKHYKIDENKHFKLIKSIECNYKYDSPSSDSPTSWECK